MNSIEVEKLAFSYHETPVLQEVSFSVEEREFIGLFGPNGGGKTTLLQLLMGFLKPTKGKISLFGKLPKQVRKKIGWVPQNFHYDRHFPISVFEVVLEGRLSRMGWSGRFSKNDGEAAREALEKMGMGACAKKAFSELSGGQAQRVLIARALASEPSLLLLDEPTASVDLSTQREIYKTLNELKGKMTIVMVTHDLHAAAEHVDRVFLVQGKVSALTIEQVCEHFAIGLYHPPLREKGGR